MQRICPPQGMAVLHSLRQLVISEYLVAKRADRQRSSDRFAKLNGVNVQFVAIIGCCSFVELSLYSTSLFLPCAGSFLSLLLSLKC